MFIEQLPYPFGAGSLWLYAAVFALYFSYRFYTFVRCPPEIAHIPAPPLLPQILSIILLRPYHVVWETLEKEMVEKHPVFRVFHHGEWSVVVARPHLATFLLNNHYVVDKDAEPFRNPITLKDQLFNGTTAFVKMDEWVRKRRIVTPAFHRGFDCEVFGDCAKKLLDAVEAEAVERHASETKDSAKMEQIAKDFRRGTFTRTVPVKGHPEKTTTEEVPVKVVNAGKLFGRLTLDVFGKALSSIDFDAIHNPENAKVEQYYRVLWNMFHPLYNLFPMLESLGVRSKVRQATYAIIDSFIEIVKKRREEIMAARAALLEKGISEFDADGEGYGHNEKLDLMQMILDSSAEYVKEDEANHKGYSHEEIRNELWGFNLAAIDTTAKALTSCTYLLAIHPEIQEKVRDEVLQVLGDEPHDVYPTVGELKNMPFLEAVLKETLRLYSPVYKLITRRTTEDVPLPDDGIIIPRNTKIGFHFHGIHMLNEVWPEATSYKPERWLDRKEVAGEFMPFGHGARRCPGEPMSMLEQKVTMAMMLRRFTWELPADHQGAGMTRIGLVTVADQRVMFKPRHLD